MVHISERERVVIYSEQNQKHEYRSQMGSVEFMTFVLRSTFCQLQTSEIGNQFLQSRSIRVYLRKSLKIN